MTPAPCSGGEGEKGRGSGGVGLGGWEGWCGGEAHMCSKQDFACEKREGSVLYNVVCDCSLIQVYHLTHPIRFQCGVWRGISSEMLADFVQVRPLVNRPLFLDYRARWVAERITQNGAEPAAISAIAADLRGGRGAMHELALAQFVAGKRSGMREQLQAAHDDDALPFEGRMVHAGRTVVASAEPKRGKRRREGEQCQSIISVLLDNGKREWMNIEDVANME